MINTNSYFKYKLSLKLNLIMSRGKSKSGIISDSIINKLMKKIDDFGKYEIIWDRNGSLPIDIEKLPSDSYIKLVNGSYLIGNTPQSLRVMYPSQFIEFIISDYRNIQLKEVLKSK